MVSMTGLHVSMYSGLLCVHADRFSGCSSPCRVTKIFTLSSAILCGPVVILCVVLCVAKLLLTQLHVLADIIGSATGSHCRLAQVVHDDAVHRIAVAKAPQLLVYSCSYLCIAPFHLDAPDRAVNLWKIL